MIECEIVFDKCSIISSDVQAKASASYFNDNIIFRGFFLWHTQIRMVQMRKGDWKRLSYGQLIVAVATKCIHIVHLLVSKLVCR